MTRIRFVESAQRLGLNLNEIAQLLKLEGGTSCSEVAEIAELRLDDVRARLEDPAPMEQVLSRLVDQCRREHQSRACPVIESLQTRN